MFSIPLVLLEAFEAGADCAISVSGGKDSQALLTAVVAWWRAQRYSGRLFAIFADLGRAEWQQTRPFLAHLCQSLQVELIVVHRAAGDLLDKFEERRATLEDSAPFWPSSAARYCTSDLKRSPIDQYLRSSQLVVSAEGIRAKESRARAQKPSVSLRQGISGKQYRESASPEDAWLLYRQERQEEYDAYHQLTLFADLDPVSAQPSQHGPRLAFTWYPILGWSREQVWQACGTTQEELDERRILYQEGVTNQNASMREQALAGWPAHPAYVMGANRLSCSLCILGDVPTLLAGARAQPEYYRSLCWLEIQSGYSFQPQRWLCDLLPELLTEEMRMLLEQHPRRQQWLVLLAERAQRKLQRMQAKKTPGKSRHVLPVIHV
ncbi:phosphoadenosine phosphosulfate reductase domain-containing protein [Dictyobacter formicarum]|uniref:Phosphoadenosine phosphosulphate reductase domain-containing protein n=1 Tax=Dictyobacter formicarum TaxID=2778368 RepID=A0ABQ3VR88_9CHLR|nr:phosphoadenosine phosphosulfate reductase family protein [Dictyobacter formicarum]GHO88209.1 hypothetical protein KSZ_62150 [Dictyobacter formicarum]